MPKKNARSVAAKKGWETRRRNARSLAAKKGWRTRRKNLRKKKVKRKIGIGGGRAVDYQVNVKYAPMKGKHLEVQINARGPAGKSKEDAQKAIEFRQSTGKDLPSWKTDIKFWQKGRSRSLANDEIAWQKLGSFLKNKKTKVE